MRNEQNKKKESSSKGGSSFWSSVQQVIMSSGAAFSLRNRAHKGGNSAAAAAASNASNASSSAAAAANNNKAKAATVVPAGYDILQVMIEQAEYQVHVDPYRGMFANATPPPVGVAVVVAANNGDSLLENNTIMMNNGDDETKTSTAVTAADAPAQSPAENNNNDVICQDKQAVPSAVATSGGGSSLTTTVTAVAMTISDENEKKSEATTVATTVADAEPVVNMVTAENATTDKQDGTTAVNNNGDTSVVTGNGTTCSINIVQDEKKSIAAETLLVEPVAVAGVDTTTDKGKQQEGTVVTNYVPNVNAVTINGHDNDDVKNYIGPSPWKACAFGSFQTTTASAAHHDNNNNNDDDSSHDDNDNANNGSSSGGDDDYATSLVQMVTQSSCPCLTAWTANAMQRHERAKSRKRKRKTNKTTAASDTADDNEIVFGERPTRPDKNFSCACDFNPYCLVSLGGVMNEICKNACPALDETETIEGGQAAVAAAAVQRDGSNDSSAVDVDAEEPDKLQDGDDVQVVVVIDDGDKKPAAKQKSSDDSTDDDELEVVDVTPSLLNSSGFQLDFTKDGSIYRTVTVDELSQNRKSVWVDREPAKEYLSRTLQGLTAAASVDECMTTLCNRHKELIFSNPLLTDAVNCRSNGRDKNRMLLSLPPGIENLGATCYLNTQLQCLAQNLVFMEGIFSWTAGDNQDDRMSSVICHLQLLLANLRAGPNNTYNTIEFSNALGLDHYEQQDPNEFSRLLLERMHESFQSGDKQTPNQSGHDLSTLLPHLFQGMITYETTCLTCQNTSQRSEEFMDLNLPIVHPSDVAPRKTGQQSILESFASSTDTDVQFCLDRYRYEEIMDGDNQYHCSQCDCKRDAKRELTFSKLPPVLNVQLSRYVFDRVSLQKKKLSSKVVLPTVIHVAAKGKELNAECTEHRYVLCAVMRHKGNSAYNGHYVAEAMDWSTGKWFEFNDQTVTLLHDGPSCSYDPSASPKIKPSALSTATGGSKKRKTASLSGSQDAYNMYYVEESFLAQATLDSLRPKPALKDNTATRSNTATSSSDGEGVPLVLRDVDRRRSERYEHLQRMCVYDMRSANRLEKRRDLICNDLFPGFSSLNTASDCVWVRGDLLRRFMSCTDTLSDVIDPGGLGPILRHDRLLCSHATRGIPPCIALRGKLLPRELYDVYVSALRSEQTDEATYVATLRSEQADQATFPAEKDERISDCDVTLVENLFCQDCADEHRSNVSVKLAMVKPLKFLWERLDPKESEPSLVKEADETHEREEDEFVYVVSKKFITRFRGACGRVMKAVSSQYLGEQRVQGGLDRLDLSEFDGSGTTGSESMDPSINGSLTCGHGNLAVRNKRSIRYVTKDVWSALSSVFPAAIELKIKRKSSNEEEQDDADDDDDDDCKECVAASQGRDHLKSRLSELAKHCLGDGLPEAIELQELLQKEASEPSTNQYRLLHKDDVLVWDHLVTIFQRKSIASMEKALVSFVEDMEETSPSQDGYRRFLSDSSDEGDRPTSASDCMRLDFFSKLFRSITCIEHHQPVSTAIYRDTVESDNVAMSKLPTLFSGRYLVMEEDAYQNFLATLAAIAVVISPDSDEPLHEQLTRQSQDELRDGAAFVTKWRIDSHHPPFRAGQRQDSERFIVSSKTLSMLFSFGCAVCSDAECSKASPCWQARHEEATTPPNGNGTTKSARVASGSAAHDPIALESDLEDDIVAGKFSLRIFEVDRDADQELALSVLNQCCTSPPSDADLGDGGPRRSTRKRKARYPVGAIKSEMTVEIAMHHNVAALRMLLLAGSEKFSLEHNLSLVIAAAPFSETPGSGNAKVDGLVAVASKEGTDFENSQGSASQIVDLSDDVVLLNETPDSKEALVAGESGERRAIAHLTFDLVGKTLLEVCESAVGVTASKALNPTVDLVVLHQPTDAGSTEPGAMMDTLFELSNMDDSKNNKSSRKKVTEKGFTGTFLSSGPVAAPKVDEIDADGQDTIIAVDADKDEDDAEDGKERATKKAKTNGSTDVHSLPEPKGAHDGLDASNSRQPKGTSAKKAAIVAFMEEDDDSGDDALLQGGLSSPDPSHKSTRTQPRRNGNGNRVNGEAQPQNAEMSEMALQTEVLQSLIQLGKKDEMDEAEAWEVAAWAFGKFPQERDAKVLVREAFAEFRRQDEKSNDLQREMGAAMASARAAVAAVDDDDDVMVARRDKVAELLLELSPDMDKAKAASAARWATSQNAKESDPRKLVDTAFAKYLEE